MWIVRPQRPTLGPYAGIVVAVTNRPLDRACGIGDVLANARPCPMCGTEQIDAESPCCTACGEQLPWSPQAKLQQTGQVDAAMIRRFRNGTLRLGLTWVFCGLVCVGLGVFELPMALRPNPNMLLILVGLGVFTVVAGVLTSFRLMPATFAGLLGGLYLFVFAIPYAFELEWSSLFLVTAYAAMIAQAIPMLELARQIRSAGLGLDTTPDEVDGS